MTTDEYGNFLPGTAYQLHPICTGPGCKERSGSIRIFVDQNGRDDGSSHCVLRAFAIHVLAGVLIARLFKPEGSVNQTTTELI